MTTPRYHRDDPCPVPSCDGYLGIATTKPDGDGIGVRTRYFQCRKCGHRVSCEVPTESVPTKTVLAKYETLFGNLDSPNISGVLSNIETQDLLDDGASATIE